MLTKILFCTVHSIELLESTQTYFIFFVFSPETAKKKDYIYAHECINHIQYSNYALP